MDRIGNPSGTSLADAAIPGQFGNVEYTGAKSGYVTSWFLTEWSRYVHCVSGRDKGKNNTCTPPDIAIADRNTLCDDGAWMRSERTEGLALQGKSAPVDLTYPTRPEIPSICKLDPQNRFALGRCGGVIGSGVASQCSSEIGRVEMLVEL